MPVQLDALQGRTFTGQITGISASANRESRVFNIEVTLPNRDRSLNVGMIARIRIVQANTQTVPVVPLTALMTAESGSNNYSIFTVTERDDKQFAQKSWVLPQGSMTEVTPCFTAKFFPSRIAAAN